MSFLNFGKPKNQNPSNNSSPKPSTSSNGKFDSSQDLDITDDDLQSIYSDIKIWALKNKGKYPNYLELYKHLPLEINSTKDLVCVAWALYNGAANPKDHEETRQPMRDPLVEWYIDGFYSSFEVLLNPDFFSATTKYVGRVIAGDLDNLFIESFKTNGMAFAAQMDEREALYLQPASQTKLEAKAFAQDLAEIYNNDQRFEAECENLPHLAKIVVDIDAYRPGDAFGSASIYVDEAHTITKIIGTTYKLNPSDKELQALLHDTKFREEIFAYGVFNSKTLASELEDSLFRHGNPPSKQKINDLTEYLLKSHDIQRSTLVGIGKALIMRKIGQSHEEFLAQAPTFIKRLNIFLVHVIYPGKATKDMIDLTTNDQAMEL